MLGAQVMNGMGNDKRQESATKRRPTMQATNQMPGGRQTQAAGWAKGQLPVAMQQQQAQKTSNSMYGQGAVIRQGSQNQKRAQAGQAFGIPSGASNMNPVNQPKIATMNVRNRF